MREQIAGDELVSQSLNEDLHPESIAKLAATGFLRMAPDGTSSGGVDRAEAANQNIADTIQIMSSAFLGLTVGCARCHDHRYDPISQADYYRMRAIFEPALDWKQWKTPSKGEVSSIRRPASSNASRSKNWPRRPSRKVKGNRAHFQNVVRRAARGSR